MNKLPTAEEFLNGQGIPEDNFKNLPWFDYGNLLTWLEEYSNMKAIFHVQAALEAAVSSAEYKQEWNGNIYGSLNKDSILNAYPENLII